MIETFLNRQPCGEGGCVPEEHRVQSQRDLFWGVEDDGIQQAVPQTDEQVQKSAMEFFQRAVTEDLSPANVFRITITSFMDAYNFDVRQVMKSCVHHVLPTGHLIPFSAYNVLYRDGHVPLPELNSPVLQSEVNQSPLPTSSPSDLVKIKRNP